jgi:hypothetical protein
MDRIDLAQDREEPVEGSCEHGNEPSGSIKCLKVLEPSGSIKFFEVL